MTINELYAMRKDGLQALIDNGWFAGFKRLLTDLYPDNAHFIYELLQNAEDAGASEVQFILNADRLEFEHNGPKLFGINDVKSITDIGNSTKKADDPTNIGKFGIGFKAVFAYTNTPEIESGEFHFRIRNMLVPDTEGLSEGALGARKTRFVFPFDNPRKPLEKAVAEIEKNLRELNENTLLFLNNIHQINYNLPDSKEGSLERKKMLMIETGLKFLSSTQKVYHPGPHTISDLRKMLMFKTKTINLNAVKSRLLLAWIKLKTGTGKSYH